MLTPSSEPPALKIAIYRTSSIGDCVLATACLDLLSKLPVPTEVTWIGRGAALDLVASAWPAITPIDLKRTDTGKELARIVEELGQKARVHVMIDLQCNLRSRWFGRSLRKSFNIPILATEKAQLTRSRLLVEARVRGRRKPLPEMALQPKFMQYQMMCETLKKALHRQLPVEMRESIDNTPPRPRLPIHSATSEDQDTPWIKELRFGHWLAIAPGAQHPTKQAPLSLFKDTLEWLRVAYDQKSQPKPLGLLLIGDQEDRVVARELLDKIDWQEPVLNLCGKLSLWETTIALSECAVLFSNDSALGHIAEAVDTPTCVVFGPTIESFGFKPRMRESKAFSALLGCRPCSKHGRTPCRYDDNLCFHSLPHAEIGQFILEAVVHSAKKNRTEGLIA